MADTENTAATENVDNTNEENAVVEVQTNAKEEIVTDLPEELKTLYDTLYQKISGMIGGRKIDRGSVARLVKILLENCMEIVEKFKNEDGTGWSGYEKKEHAINMAVYIIKTLKRDGKIDAQVADDILLGIEIFGSAAIDMVIDAVKHVFDVGQDIVENGCAGCTQRNKCCIA